MNKILVIAILILTACSGPNTTADIQAPAEPASVAQEPQAPDQTTVVAEPPAPPDTPELSAVAPADTVDVEMNKSLALEAATTWLDLIDKGSYNASHDLTSDAFKAQVTKSQWSDTMDGIVNQIGGITSRTFESSEYATELPQTPPGEYVIIKYFSSTSAGPEVVETIALVKSDEDAWLVTGYFLAPR